MTTTRRPSEELIRQTVATVGGYRPAARALAEMGFDISETSIRRVFGRAVEDDSFSVELPGGRTSSHIDVNELIQRRVIQYEAKRTNHELQKTIPVSVNLDGPIGLGFAGDPHVDDDGTDLALLFKHTALFDGRNPGLFLGNIGDVTNNWTGRLARLWAEQSTSAAEARALATEYLQMVRWFFFLFGNHDEWGDGAQILSLVLGNRAPIQKSSNVRLEVRFPNGRTCRINAAHDFAGSSMWSTVYGPAKRAQLDGDCDIYACGHTHVSGYTHGWNDPQQRMWHALRIASYKRIDRYAETLNLPDKTLYTCPVALIDPQAKDPVNFIRWEFDPEEGAERLRWMRARYEAGRSAS